MMPLEGAAASELILLRRSLLWLADRVQDWRAGGPPIDVREVQASLCLEEVRRMFFADSRGAVLRAGAAGEAGPDPRVTLPDEDA